VAILLANGVFGVFNAIEPTKHANQSFPSFKFSNVIRSTSASICIFHYFSRIFKEMAKGNLKVERKLALKVPNFEESTKSLSKTTIYPKELIEDLGTGLHADFANEYIGGGVLDGGNVQEEILFVIKPECLVTLLFCAKMEDIEAIIIHGAERFSKYSGYGACWKFAGDYVDDSERDSSHSIITKIIAIDATVAFGGKGQWAQELFNRDIIKAFVGFADYKDETKKLPIITGNWGCGAFGGSKPLKFLQQLLVASEVERELLYCTLSAPIATEFETFLKEVEGATVGELYHLYFEVIKTENNPFEDVLSYLSSQFKKSKTSQN